MRTRFGRGAGLVIALLGAVSLVGIGDSGGTVSLAEGIDRVLRTDAGLRQAELQLERARLEMEAAIASVSLPSVTFTLTPPILSADGWGGDLKGTVGAALSLPLLTSSAVSAGLDVGLGGGAVLQVTGWRAAVSQRIDPANPRPTAERLDVRRRAVDEAEAAVAAKESALVLDTISTYTGLLAGRERVARIEAALERAEVRLRDTEDRIAHGLRGESDRIDAQLAVLDARIRLDQARADSERGRTAFLQKIGLDSETDLSPYELPAPEIRAAAAELLARSDLIDAAVASSSAVRSAKRALVEAEAALRAVRLEAFPSLSIDLGIDERGWTIGWRLSFDLVSPDRGARARIAEVDRELAEIRLCSAIDAEREAIRAVAANLSAAISDLDRLALEEEQWTLQVAAARRRWEAGSMSDGEWGALLEEEDAFHSDARQRVTDLFISYLRFRDALGLELEWEGWLQ